MAPYTPEEIDVFAVPHTRMKELVNSYVEMIECTNFSSECDLSTLLESLFKTFLEFRDHEQIENKLIMRRLKNKLKQVNMLHKNSLVCNCHKDSQLTSIIELLQAGYSKKTSSDRINYGIQLRRVLDDFTKQFVPHMQEEEEIFQPLMQKYFSPSELMEIKHNVIHQHFVKKTAQDSVQLEKWVIDLTENDTSSESSDDECKQLAKARQQAAEVGWKSKKHTIIDRLPDEIIIKILRYLSPQDLCKIGGVSQRYHHLVYDSTLWKAVYPVLWARGHWVGYGSNHKSIDQYISECDDDGDDDSEGDEVDEDTGDEYYVADEDADVDESEYNNITPKIQREAEVLTGVVRYLLPKIGKFVKIVDLAHSKTLTNFMMQKIVRLCPNVECLYLINTYITDCALKPIGINGRGNRLQRVNLSGCINIGDISLIRLASALQGTYKPYPENYDTVNSNQSHSTVVMHENRAVTGQPNYTASHTSSDRSSSIVSNDSDVACNDSLYSNDTGYATPDNDRLRIGEWAQRDSFSSDDLLSCGDSKSMYGSSSSSTDSPVNVPSHLFVSDADYGDVSSDDCTHACPLYVDEEHIPSIEDCYDVMLYKSMCVCKHNASENVYSSPCTTGSLQYLNVSGCLNITNCGLGALSRVASQLVYANFSGCMRLTGTALSTFAAAAPHLLPEMLYYCDNIVDGPYSYSASGCCNVGNENKRFCCRKGQS